LTALTPPTAEKSARFPLVDLLRGCSALLVVFYHVLSMRPWPNFDTTGIGKLPTLGWVGVDLFFVISGFVIGKTAMDGHLSGQPWRQRYFSRRLARIVPLYLATLAVWVILVNPTLLTYRSASVYHIATHLGFIHNLWHETHGSINPPSWSVGLEMQFYILIALCAPWLAKSSVWKILVVWISIALTWKYTSTVLLPPGSSTPIVQFIYASQLPGVLDEFALGIVIAKLLQQDLLQFTWRRLIAWSLIASGLLTAAWITVGTGELYWTSTTTIIFWRTLACAGFAALLACVVMIPHSGGWAIRPFRYLGEISYGIYLWHMPVLATFLAKTQWQGLQLLLATFACTITLAALSWHGFEKLWIARPTPHPRAKSSLS
jgi:peptidoglycan/LPS O-acetylase OafA/YrhL